MFGATKPTGFSGFGTSTSTGGGFGSSNAFGTSTPSGGGGLFGGGASGTTGMSGGGLFGSQPQATTGFGQQPQATGGGGGFSFGGTPQAATGGGGLFGSTSQAATGGGSLFSTPASGTGFGANKAFSGFGSTAQQPAANTGGLFGASASAGGGGGSLFGQPSGAGAFGSAVGAQGGTTVAFNAPSGEDTMMKNQQQTKINTKHQCITAMREYENKSIEELRVEDYTANRKSKQPGSTTAAAGGMFGQTPASSSSGGSGFVFGGGGVGALGATGGINSGASTGFGGFGTTPAAAATTPFGAANQTRPLFGTATTTQSGFSFGAATGTQQSSSLFGSTARPLFGGAATTQASLTGGFGGFGASAAGTATTGGFGANTGTNLFGAKPTGFGAAATTASLGFGSGGSMFGAKPTATAASFGFGTNTSTSGFGGTSGGGLFGTKPTGFGTTTTALGGGGAFSFGGGLGGATAAPSTFGTAAAKPGFNSGFNFGGTGTAGITGGFGTNTLGGAGTFNLGGGAAALGSANQTAAASTQHLLALASSPYGDNPLFWNVRQQSKEKREDILKPTNPNAQKAVLSEANKYKVSPRPATKIKPKSLHGLMNGSKNQLFEGLEEEDFSFGDDTFVPRKSVKKLVLRKGLGNKSQTSTSSSFYSDTGGDSPHTTMHLHDNRSSNNLPMPITRPLSDLQRADTSIDNEAEALSPEQTPVSRPPVKKISSLDDSVILGQKVPSFSNTSHTPDGHNRMGAADTTSFLDGSDLDGSCWVVDSSTPHPTGVMLNRPGYYTIPTLDDMTSLMDEEGNVCVEDLTVGRVGYGNVFFPGTTNVAGMNLDEIVHFRRKEVVVYPDDDKKPPLGDGLNKKAEVTLDCVWPTDKSTRTPIKSPERLKVMSYADKIEETTAKIGAKFIDYRPETGSWVFQVGHFSKYGLDDSDEEDMETTQKKVIGQQVKDALLVQKLKTQVQQQMQQKEMEKQQQLDTLQESFLSEKGEEMEREEDLSGLRGEDSWEMGDEDAQVKRRLQEEGVDSKHLVASMGVSARNIQGMKASFFGGMDDQPEYKKMREPVEKSESDNYEDLHRMWKKSGDTKVGSSLFGAFKHPASLSLPQSPAFSDKESYGKDGYEPVAFPKSGLLGSGLSKDVLRPTPQTFMHPPVMEHKLLTSRLQPEEGPHRILGSRSRQMVHPRDSVLFRNQKSQVDEGCFMGRAFRVGWGPSWSLVHSGFSTGSSEEDLGNTSILPGPKGRPQPGPKAWTTTTEQLQVYDYMDPHNHTVLQQQEALLEIQLHHSHVAMEDGCPLVVPQPGVDALHMLAQALEGTQADLAGSPDGPVQEHSRQVFGLCEALWGNLADSQDLDKEDTYINTQLRRESLSQWLAGTSAARVADEMEAAPVISPEGCLQAVFSQLTVRQVSDACLLAQRGRDHRMALLLAQACTGQACREMLSAQLDKWCELEMCQFVSSWRMKIYCLLGGHLLWTTKDTEVNTCQGLDWKRALALHLWYKCPSGASVQQALSHYQAGFQGTKATPPYCPAPRAPYLEGEALEAGEEKVLDTAYHLLCLYTESRYPLEALLSPEASTPSRLDFRLSWHLMRTLQSLGYSHLAPQVRDSVHVSFASQLEALGLWHWAVLVLLHIPGAAQRTQAVTSLLQRHLTPGEELTDREEFLVSRLLVPREWLHHAKAVSAAGQPEAQARHWLLAGQYARAHAVVLQHIAPDAIINDQYSHLRTFLEEMATPERSMGIQGWASNGKVFLDFMDIKRQLDQWRASPPGTHALEGMEPAVLSLCTRVKALTCTTARDRLCQAEMAKMAASLLRSFLVLQGKPSVSVLLQHIPDLPMPEDYKLQELQAITRARLMEIA